MISGTLLRRVIDWLVPALAGRRPATTAAPRQFAPQLEPAPLGPNLNSCEVIDRREKTRGNLPTPPPWLTLESLTALRYTPDAMRHRRWRAAFQFYNEHHPRAPLGMRCRPCYEKVRTYLAAVLAAHLPPR